MTFSNSGRSSLRKLFRAEQQRPPGFEQASLDDVLRSAVVRLHEETA